MLDQNQFHSILVNQMIPSAIALFPSGEYIFFQQDNDPKHTAKKNQLYLSNKKVSVLEWPSQSPDLNPIENLWSYVDRQLQERNPKNEDELFNIIKQCWESLNVRNIDSVGWEYAPSVVV